MDVWFGSDTTVLCEVGKLYVSYAVMCNKSDAEDDTHEGTGHGLSTAEMGKHWILW